MTTKLVDYIIDHEDWLMERILGYAIKRGYSQYTSTLKEAWRLSISGLSQSLVEAIQSRAEGLELCPVEDYTKDPAARFGIDEAQRHRERGVSLAMFLGLMKYYQQVYVELIKESDFDNSAKSRYENLTNRFFDRVEIGFCTTWASSSDDIIVKELQDRNRQMTNEKNKYLTIFESLSRPVFIVDSLGQIEGMNHAAANILKIDTVPGENYYGIDYPKIEFVDLFPWLKDTYRDFLDRNEITVYYEKSINDPLQYFYISCSRSLDISGKFQGTIFVIEDITKRKEMEKELKNLASTDPLTGAKNRRSFLHLFEQEVLRFKRYGHSFGLIMLDIDHFKKINDTFGHDIGDKVLKNLAAESLGVLRDSDIFGRWGGEEFIAFLPETNIHESSMIAERLRSKLSRIEVSDRKGRLVTITVSIGLRVVTSGETDVLVDEVIREADDALYMAKKEGRNRVVLL